VPGSLVGWLVVDQKRRPMWPARTPFPSSFLLQLSKVTCMQPNPVALRPVGPCGKAPRHRRRAIRSRDAARS